MKNLILILFCGLICAAGCNKDDPLENGTVENLTWSISEDGTLTISGKGAIKDFSEEETSPWYEFRNDITKVIIGNDVSHIGNNAFYWHNNLTSVVIGSSVTTIGDCAFQFCSRLTEIVNYQKTPQIVEEMRIMGEHWGVFGRLYKPNCTLWVPAGSVEAYRSADVWSGFHKTGVIGDPNSIPTGIGGKEGAVKWVLDDDGILTISGTGNMPFYNIYGTRHGQPTHPEWYWIANSILHVVIKEGVNNISYYAFWGCANIISIIIPASVTNIGSFPECAVINVVAGNLNYSSSDGILFNKKQTELIKYPPSKQGEAYIIPNSVSEIFSSAFTGNANLTSITIPNSVTIIGDNAFWNCKGLTEIINHQTTPQKIFSFNSLFFGVDKEKCALFVPAGSVDSYRAADGWEEFVNIYPIQ